MKSKQFKLLVKQLEKEAEKSPTQYKRKILLLALLGNLYVVTIIAGLFGLMAALFLSIPILQLVAVALIPSLGVFLYFVFKALWIRIEPPQGYEIDEQQAPELFTIIHALQQELHCAPLHHVLITQEFNAGAIQVPRLGVFGWPKNYLVIGLPMMKLLSAEQLKAVLAHELGHLSQGHGKLANKIYCQRQRWEQLVKALDQNKSFGSFLFKPFFHWFAPYFAACSFPMARRDEYQADQMAAKLTSPQVAAQALTSTNVFAHYLYEKYWPSINRLANKMPQPRYMPFVNLGKQINHHISPDDVKNWLQVAIASTTSIDDTHPALSDRLKALGQKPSLKIPESSQTADQLLGDSLERIADQFDQEWLTHVSDSWLAHYQQTQTERKALNKLNRMIEQGENISVEQAYHRARLTLSLDNNLDSAFKQFSLLYKRAPEDARICLALGSCFLEKNDYTGCNLIEQAIKLEPDLLQTGGERIQAYYQQIGDPARAHDWQHRLMEQSALTANAKQERSQLNIDDKTIPHHLPERSIKLIQHKLRRLPKIRKAYLVRKEVEFMPDAPCYVLGVCFDRWLSQPRKADMTAIRQQIREEVQLPKGTLIVRLDGKKRRYLQLFLWKKHSRLI